MIKKKSNGKVVAHKVEKKDWSWNRSIWVPKEIITNMKGPQMVWVLKDTGSPRISFGGFRGLAYKMMRRPKPKKLSSQLGHLVPKSSIM